MSGARDFQDHIEAAIKERHQYRASKKRWSRKAYITRLILLSTISCPTMSDRCDQPTLSTICGPYDITSAELCD